MKTDSNIAMYWWEGFYGFNNLLQRILKGKTPFVKNVGDALSPLIISLLTDKKICHTVSSHKLLALGSIFFALRDNDIVWGSGFLNAKHIQFALSCREVIYLAVRGPETRKLLMQHNLPCPEVYGDPAILLPHLIENDITKKYEIGVVPHFLHYQYFLTIYKSNNIKIINVEDSLADVIRSILSCKIILSTSLHGLILAEAYGIPALMLIIDKPLHGDLFKFEDYFHSTNRSLSFYPSNTKKISILADLALKQPKPHFEPKKLLDTFPFKNNHLNLNSPLLTWSNMKQINYKHSIIPPRFRVPG